MAHQIVSRDIVIKPLKNHRLHPSLSWSKMLSMMDLIQSEESKKNKKNFKKFNELTMRK